MSGYCVNISGQLYPHDSIPWNLTDLDDSLEFLTGLDTNTSAILSGNGGIYYDTNFDVNSSRPGFVNNRNDISQNGIVCMSNPEQMLEPWEINKNLAMLISYSVIFIIGVLGNITAMLVSQQSVYNSFSLRYEFNLSFLNKGMVGDRKSRNATTMVHFYKHFISYPL